MKKPKILWYDNWYDGPLSGICKYNGKYYYFNACKENDYPAEDWYREFELFELTYGEYRRERLLQVYFEYLKGNGNIEKYYDEAPPEDRIDYCLNNYMKKERKLQETFKDLDINNET